MFKKLFSLFVGKIITIYWLIIQNNYTVEYENINTLIHILHKIQESIKERFNNVKK